MENQLSENLETRTLSFQDRELEKLLQERSKLAAKQMEVVKKLRSFNEEYERLQKEIKEFNNKIVDLTYSKYLSLIGEWEDLYEVKLEKGRVLIILKDAVEEIKKVAKDKFLENKLKWIEKKNLEKEIKEEEK